jgi:two-component system OmpR family sensor kinase
VIDEALFASVAHEVKTPLAVLRGYAELLANRQDEQIQREAPEAILEAVRRLAPAVDDLLLALEIQNGLEARSEPVDLADLLPDATQPLPVAGEPRLLRRAVDILSSESHGVSATAANGVATLVAGEAPRNELELYLVRLIAEAHGGDLRDSSTGLVLTLPLA